MMKHFTIADTHFFHGKMLTDLEKRPFVSIKEMHEHIIEQWNSVVGPEDFVWHVGDVSFGNKEQTKSVLKRLNGIKNLVWGKSHDGGRSVTWWIDCGFDAVFKKPIKVENYILSHEPLEVVPEGFINICGHVHSKVEHLSDRHICVSVENVAYTPQEIDLRNWNRVYYEFNA